MMVTITTIKSTKVFRKIQTSKSTLKFFGKNFLCLFFFQEGLTHNQLAELNIGIKASRKFGKAVVRNKFKRRIRALFYSNRNLYSCYTFRSFYFVFIPTKSASLCNFSDMQKDYSKMNIFITNRINISK